MRVYPAPFPDVSFYEKNIILRNLKDFISEKRKTELCDKCPNQFADAYCKDCDLRLCRSCSEAIHIGNNSSHRVIFGVNNLQVDACHFCLKQSDIFCPNCKIFFCKACKDVHHSDETVGTHKICITNPEYIPEFEMAPLEDSSMQTPQEIDNSMRVPVRSMNERCQLWIWKLWTFSQDLVAIKSPVNTALVFFLVMLVVIVLYIPCFPAYTILPSEEVEPVNMICRHKTKEEVYQDKKISNKQVHRTVCTFDVFHHSLLYRDRTYFVLDIDINIAKTFLGKLFTINVGHLNMEDNTQHKQHWSISRCKTKNDDLAICLDDVNNKKETLVTQKLIGTVVMEQNKRVSFLFLVDNQKQTMEIFAPVVLLKDVVFLEKCYEGHILRVWIALADLNNDMHVTARIRSGANITIGDLPNPAIVTTYQIVHGVLTYPFRCLYAYL
ncbi:uncharacterized protein LOC110467129 [Mizuhopecten yessoensis]|uniref:uncharacterized protein LOC110467129 n=1 Tax=Mizuhopecten yessoensis TaxID=6573 RepID=UPI000B45A5C0|nr:uncharacterized protein LOC110467129 [Mizuhopecten yessoensis]